MRTFKEWLEQRIDEETREEREAREQEALRRQKAMEDHMFDRELLSKPAPVGARVGSEEWIKWATENRRPSSRDQFGTAVDAAIEERLKKLGEPPSYILFWGDYDLEKEWPPAKVEADHDRMLGIISDCFEDGTTPEQTADMAIDFMRSQGYLGKSKHRRF